MADFEEELRLDAEENAREAEFILASLPNELKEKFSTDDILYMMDTIVEYYFESGVLDGDGDEDGCVDIDLQAVAEYVCRKARKTSVATSIPTMSFSWHRPTWTFRSRILTRTDVLCQ